MSEGVRARVEGFVLEAFLFADEGRMPAGSDSLIGGGVIDSTGVLELIDFLECEFDIQVADDETLPANLDSIDNICRFVESKLAAPPPS